MNLRARSIPIKELWEKPMLVAITIDEVTVAMVPIVKEFVDVFPDDLTRLPPDREIEFGIKFYRVQLQSLRRHAKWH